MFCQPCSATATIVALTAAPTAIPRLQKPHHTPLANPTLVDGNQVKFALVAKDGKPPITPQPINIVAAIKVVSLANPLMPKNIAVTTAMMKILHRGPIRSPSNPPGRENTRPPNVDIPQMRPSWAVLRFRDLPINGSITGVPNSCIKLKKPINIKNASINNGGEPFFVRGILGEVSFVCIVTIYNFYHSEFTHISGTLKGSREIYCSVIITVLICTSTVGTPFSLVGKALIFWTTSIPPVTIPKILKPLA